jgi:TM2 domain-containing membrane protein YozV
MAIYIHCPNCNARLEELRQDCTHCSADLPPGVLYALASALGKAPMPSSTTAAGRLPTHLTQSPAPPPTPAIEGPPPAHSSALRPWLAATLSLLCGLGQLYNGQIAKGMVLIVLGAAAILSIQFPIGKIMAPLVWLYAIVDAYLVARRTVES